MIFAYNPEHISDTLITIVAFDHDEKNAVDRRGDVARVTTESGELIGWNFFNISKELTITERGQVHLADAEVATLDQLIKKAGFTDNLTPDHEPKIVVGYVEECVPHPDSDHLNVTQTRVNADTVLQIVCGAPNIAAGQKVVVAKVGAMMPDGLLIWPGVLRKVESFGMICSAKELHLPDAPKERGILELAEDAVVGSAFSVGK